MTISGGEIFDMKNRASLPSQRKFSGRRWFNQIFSPGRWNTSSKGGAGVCCFPVRKVSWVFPGFPIGFPHRRISNIRPGVRADLPRGRWVQKWTRNLRNQISRNQNCCQKEISWLVQNFDVKSVHFAFWRQFIVVGWGQEIKRWSVINSLEAVMTLTARLVSGLSGFVINLIYEYNDDDWMMMTWWWHIAARLVAQRVINL